MWTRSHRLETKHPGRLSFASAIKEDGDIDDEKGIQILEDREKVLESLVEKARRDRLYVHRKYSDGAVQCRRLIDQIVDYLQDEYLATKYARIHCYTGGCLIQKGSDCVPDCFKWILADRESFGQLARRLRLASFEEGWFKLP